MIHTAYSAFIRLSTLHADRRRLPQDHYLFMYIDMPAINVRKVQLSAIW